MKKTMKIKGNVVGTLQEYDGRLKIKNMDGDVFSLAIIYRIIILTDKS